MLFLSGQWKKHRAKTENLYPIGSIFFLYTTIDALLSSMGEQNPEDPLVKALRREFSRIDEIAGKPLYSYDHPKLESEKFSEIAPIIEKILRRLGVIRSGTSEADDEKECSMMEEELK
jgi:hypothetical protein